MLGGRRPRFHAAIGPDGAVADAGRRPRRARAAIRLRDSAVLRFDDRQDHQPWRRPQRGAGPADLRAGADRGVRRHHQSGISDLLPAASRLCRGRGDHGVHRPIIATNCWRRARTTTRKRRLRRCCFTSPIRMRRHGGAGDQPGGDVSADGADRSRPWRRTRSTSCASAMAAMSQASRAASSVSRSTNSAAIRSAFASTA